MEIENVIERLEQQIETWQEKLEGFTADLCLAEEKCSALETERIHFLFYGLGEIKTFCFQSIEIKDL